MARPSPLRNGLLWTCGLLAAAFLAHGALWLRSAYRLDALVEEQAQALRGQGWRVVLGPARPEGWPGHAGLRFGPTSIKADGFTWQADRATIDAPLRWPEAISGIIPGPAHLRAEGQQLRFGSAAPLAVVSKDLQLEISGGSAILAGTDVGIAHAFEAETLQLRLGPEGLALAARHLKPLDAAGARGQVLDALSLHASAMPPVQFTGNLRAAAVAWHQTGGVVEVSDVALTMSRAHALGTCRVWLDDALQPRLDGTMRVIGYEAGLDELAAAGVLTRQTVVAAKAVLGLLAAPTSDGGADIPVQVTDGALAVARFPLLRVPVLDWPAAPPEP